MTEARLAVYSVPDRFEIDAPFAAGAGEERDVPILAPAFRDPRVGDEAGIPRVDGSILGGATLRHFDPMRGVIEVRYRLLPEARGRGLPTEALRAVTSEAFASGIPRIEANVRLGNDASERVLEHAGFSRGGIRRRLLRHGGRHVDATAYSLVADDE